MQLLMWRGTKARGDAWRIIRFCVWGGVRAVHRCEYTRYCPHLTTHEVECQGVGYITNNNPKTKTIRTLGRGGSWVWAIV